MSSRIHQVPSVPRRVQVCFELSDGLVYLADVLGHSALLKFHMNFLPACSHYVEIHFNNDVALCCQHEGLANDQKPIRPAMPPRVSVRSQQFLDKPRPIELLDGLIHLADVLSSIILSKVATDFLQACCDSVKIHLMMM